jgi:putative acetyltransferase
MLIRPEIPTDFDAIYAVHAAAFPTVGEAGLVNALRASSRLFVSLVAVVADQVVGHVAFSPVSIDGISLGQGLAPVAVRADQRRQGVAERLVRAGLETCGKAAVGLVVVLGSPYYYSRFGFEPAKRWNLRNEYNGGDAFQAMELVCGAIPVGGGLVRYSPEFAALESS